MDHHGAGAFGERLRLVSGSNDGTALVWDRRALHDSEVPTAPCRRSGSSNSLQRRDKTPRRPRAILRFQRAPQQTVAFLRKRLLPIAASDQIQTARLSRREPLRCWSDCKQRKPERSSGIGSWRAPGVWLTQEAAEACASLNKRTLFCLLAARAKFGGRIASSAQSRLPTIRLRFPSSSAWRQIRGRRSYRLDKSSVAQTMLPATRKAGFPV